eukprot:TRINITY_DN1775_c0_g1_i2.p1 TRINITY_DN1775_c0_g1~~TRINITY_DN1775_c0_g1_i2.p1  ORF type:complete len:355 (-),score=90.17 TRINITY_DN1775_c0_g1_i2:34-1098(-)
MVLQKQGEVLYEGVKKAVEDHVATFVEKIGEGELDVLLDIWDRHRKEMSYIRDILMYLERTHIAENKLPSLFDIGTASFLNVLSTQVDKKVDHIVKAILNYRNQPLGVKQEETRRVLKMLWELKTYGEAVEVPLLRDSVVYFNSQAENMIQRKVSLSDYLDKVGDLWFEESLFVDNYLPSEAKPSYEQTFYGCFVHSRLSFLLGDSLKELLKGGKLEVVAKLFNACSVGPGDADALQTAISNHLRQNGDNTPIATFMKTLKDKAVEVKAQEEKRRKKKLRVRIVCRTMGGTDTELMVYPDNSLLKVATKYLKKTGDTEGDPRKINFLKDRKCFLSETIQGLGVQDGDLFRLSFQ